MDGWWEERAERDDAASADGKKQRDASHTWTLMLTCCLHAFGWRSRKSPDCGGLTASRSACLLLGPPRPRPELTEALTIKVNFHLQSFLVYSN